MTAPTFATASISQRVQMIEDALERILDRGPEMSVSGNQPGEAKSVWVLDWPYVDDTRVGHSLYTIARELEALLP